MGTVLDVGTSSGGYLTDGGTEALMRVQFRV